MENNDKDFIINLFQQSAGDQGLVDMANMLKNLFDAFVAVGFTEPQAMAMIIETIKATIYGSMGKGA